MRLPFSTVPAFSFPAEIHLWTGCVAVSGIVVAAVDLFRPSAAMRLWLPPVISLLTTFFLRLIIRDWARENAIPFTTWADRQHQRYAWIRHIGRLKSAARLYPFVVSIQFVIHEWMSGIFGNGIWRPEFVSGGAIYKLFVFPPIFFIPIFLLPRQARQAGFRLDANGKAQQIER